MPYGPASWARYPEILDFRVSLGGSALPAHGAKVTGDTVYIPHFTNLISVNPSDGMTYIGGGIVEYDGSNSGRVMYPGGADVVTGTDGGNQPTLTGFRRDCPQGRLGMINGVPFACIVGHSVAFNGTLAKSGPGRVILAANWDNEPGGYVAVQELYSIPAHDFGIGGAGYLTVDGSFFNIGDIWYFMFGASQGVSGGGGSANHLHAALWTSLDYGLTWELVRDLTAAPWATLSQPSHVVGVNRSGLRRIIALLGNASVWYSDDFGASWTQSGGNNTNAQSLYLLSSGGVLLAQRGGLIISTGTNVSCDLGANFLNSLAEPTGNANTRLGLVVVGLEEAVAAVTGGLGMRIYWSNNGGEVFAFQGEFLNVSNTSPVMDMVQLELTRQVLLYNQGRQVIRSNAQPTGTVSPRSVCPGIGSPLANAGKLVACGSPVLVNACP